MKKSAPAPAKSDSASRRAIDAPKNPAIEFIKINKDAATTICLGCAAFKLNKIGESKINSVSSKCWFLCF